MDDCPWEVKGHRRKLRPGHTAWKDPEICDRKLASKLAVAHKEMFWFLSFSICHFFRLPAAAIFFFQKHSKFSYLSEKECMLESSPCQIDGSITTKCYLLWQSSKCDHLPSTVFVFNPLLLLLLIFGDKFSFMVYLCMYVWVCLQVLVCTSVCACMWKPGDNLGHCSSVTSVSVTFL